MRKLVLGALAVFTLSTIAAVRFGGWAVVSVKDAPDYLVVGKPATIEFVVRQHGVAPMPGLEPSIEARSGWRRVRGTITTKGDTYRGTITVPTAGDWTIAIASGFGKSRGRLLPKRALAPDERAPALSDVERGRQLFAAAGCVTCHVHRSVGIDADFAAMGAPDLSDRRFAPDYLAKFLADPSIKPKSPDLMQMPNLDLRKTDIASLVAFINSERKVSSRE